MSRSPCVACVREWISIISLSQRACFAALQSQRRKKKKRESERETRRSDQRAAIVRRRPRCSSSLSRSPPALHASRARSVFPVGVKHSTSSARPSGEIRKGNRPWARSSPGEKQEQLGGRCAIEFPALFLSSIALPARPSCPPRFLSFRRSKETESGRVLAAGVENEAKGPESRRGRRNDPAALVLPQSQPPLSFPTPPLPNAKRNSASAPRAAFSTSQPPWARSPSASARSSTPSPPSSRP